MKNPRLTFTAFLLLCFVTSFSQNVGIGTTTPERPLHLHTGNFVFPSIMFSNNASGETASDGFHIGMQYQAEVPSNRYGLILVKEAIPLHIGSSNNFNQIVLSPTGSLGIGYTDPTQRLEVSGNIRMRGTGVTQKRILFSNDAGDADIASIGHLNDDVITIAAHSSNAQFSKFYFDVANEKMGVGAAPGANDGKILVNYNSSTGNPHLTLKESVLGDYSRLEFANTGAERVWHIAGQTVAGAGTTNRANDILNIWNSSRGDLMSFRGDGRVGIWTTAPANGYALSVDGKIMCEELRVQLSGAWPDYVFADNYTLMPLYGVESFIKTNRHLPGIPSALEMEKDGLSVGDMQKKMMEKIEELTLYIIQQQKEIEALKANKK